MLLPAWLGACGLQSDWVILAALGVDTPADLFDIEKSDLSDIAPLLWAKLQKVVSNKRTLALNAPAETRYLEAQPKAPSPPPREECVDTGGTTSFDITSPASASGEGNLLLLDQFSVGLEPTRLAIPGTSGLVFWPLLFMPVCTSAPRHSPDMRSKVLRRANGRRVYGQNYVRQSTNDSVLVPHDHVDVVVTNVAPSDWRLRCRMYGCGNQTAAPIVLCPGDLVCGLQHCGDGYIALLKIVRPLFHLP